MDVRSRMYKHGNDPTSENKNMPCDKIYRHRYHETYSGYLSRLDNTQGAGMVEIGCDNGASTLMWIKTFPHVHLYTCDIHDCPKRGNFVIDPNDHAINSKFTFVQADQSDESQLEQFMSHMTHPIYFINDDGSHIPEHQLITFNKMFPILKPGGVYIIEDVETSYWVRGDMGELCAGIDRESRQFNYGVDHPDSILNIFKNVIDCINLKNIPELKPASPVQHQDMIQSITFAANSIIIVKGTQHGIESTYNKYMLPVQF